VRRCHLRLLLRPPLTCGRPCFGGGDRHTRPCFGVRARVCRKLYDDGALVRNPDQLEMFLGILSPLDVLNVPVSFRYGLSPTLRFW